MLMPSPRSARHPVGATGVPRDPCSDKPSCSTGASRRTRPKRDQQPQIENVRVVPPKQGDRGHAQNEQWRRAEVVPNRTGIHRIHSDGRQDGCAGRDEPCEDASERCRCRDTCCNGPAHRLAGFGGLVSPAPLARRTRSPGVAAHVHSRDSLSCRIVDAAKDFRRIDLYRNECNRIIPRH